MQKASLCFDSINALRVLPDPPSPVEVVSARGRRSASALRRHGASGVPAHLDDRYKVGSGSDSRIRPDIDSDASRKRLISLNIFSQ